MACGTLHLAHLYAAYGGALSRLLKEGRVPTPKRVRRHNVVVAVVEATHTRVYTECTRHAFV